MYGAGHVFKGQANFYMHGGSFRNSPSDADFGHLLAGTRYGPSVRCRRAFAAGFFANKAVQCNTPYRREDPLPGFKLCHWVVLRCPAFASPVHFTSRVDFGRAIEGGVEDSVFEAFASLTEVEIFCVGAGIPIPRTGVWRSQQSGTSTMGIPASSSGSHRHYRLEVVAF